MCHSCLCLYVDSLLRRTYEEDFWVKSVTLSAASTNLVLCLIFRYSCDESADVSRQDGRANLLAGVYCLEAAAAVA